MVILDMEDMIPQNHLLRKIKAAIDFDFIYDDAESYYSKIVRPSTDPVCLMKTLLVGYLYGCTSRVIPPQLPPNEPKIKLPYPP